MENTKRKIIELEPWEAEKMNIGLKYLIETHIQKLDNFKDVPDEELKAVSWLIAFRHSTFDEQTRKPAEMVSDDEINAKIKSHE